jgi:hypothetical protein
MINLEIPKKLKPLITNAHQVALGMFRPISRKYDVAEHEYPKELDMLGAILLRRRPPAVRRPLLFLLLAGAPLVPLFTGRLLPLLVFQGSALVVIAAAAVAVALARQAGSRDTRTPAVRDVVLFAAAFLFYAVLGTRIPGPAGPQGDEPHYLVMAQSLLSDGDLDLTDEFAGREYAGFAGTRQPHTSPRAAGRIYSIHTPGLPALLLPAYAALATRVRLFMSALAALTARWSVGWCAGDGPRRGGGRGLGRLRLHAAFVLRGRAVSGGAGRARDRGLPPRAPRPGTRAAS